MGKNWSKSRALGRLARPRRIHTTLAKENPESQVIECNNAISCKSKGSSGVPEVEFTFPMTFSTYLTRFQGFQGRAPHDWSWEDESECQALWGTAVVHLWHQCPQSHQDMEWLPPHHLTCLVCLMQSVQVISIAQRCSKSHFAKSVADIIVSPAYRKQGRVSSIQL